jgi:hypothetical protein
MGGGEQMVVVDGGDVGYYLQVDDPFHYGACGAVPPRCVRTRRAYYVPDVPYIHTVLCLIVERVPCWRAWPWRCRTIWRVACLIPWRKAVWQPGAAATAAVAHTTYYLATTAHRAVLRLPYINIQVMLVV